MLSRLEERGLTLAVAESFTGGRLGDAITAVPGSSRTFLGGVIAYHNDVKRRVLDVPRNLLLRHGAVSEEVAGAMAAGAAGLLRADLGVSTTGIAGPTGATSEKPLGLSIVAVAWRRKRWTHVATHPGSRDEVKARAVEQALRLLDEVLAANPLNAAVARGRS